MPAININKVADVQQHNIQNVITQGSISLGGKSYNVSVVNDHVKVQRADIGQMSTGQRLANGIKDFFGRMFTEGAVTTRASRLESQLQGMLTQEVSRHVSTFRDDMQFCQQSFVAQNHTVQSHIETCAQTMTDDPTTKQFLLDHLNDPNFSKDRFTGIEPHPTDPAKFIAKFGDRQLEFANRESSNMELRGPGLKDKLANGHYTSLNDLIGQTYMTQYDSLMLYCFKPAAMNLAAVMQNCTPEVKDQIIASVSNLPIGNTTVGVMFDNILRNPVVTHD